MSNAFSYQNHLINKVQRFEDFFRLFQESPGVYKYQDQISDIFTKKANIIVLLYEDLLAFNSTLSEMLIKDPEALLEGAVEAFTNILRFQGSKLEHNSYHVQVKTSIKNVKLISSFKNLNSTKISQLVFCRGIVSGISQIKPVLIRGVFACNLCGSKFEIIQLTSKLHWPKYCTNKRCKAKIKSDFRLIENDSQYIDCQEIYLEEIYNDLHIDTSGIMIKARLNRNLVNSVNLGDRIQIAGILKTEDKDMSKKNQLTKFNFCIEVNDIHLFKKNGRSILSRKDIKEIKDLSQEVNLFEKIADSIFPTFPYDSDLKKACTLSLFGNNERNIHILLIGNEGVGKSTILRTLSKTFPWSFYTFGKDKEISLIPTISKNEIDGQLYVWSGALNYGKDGHTLIDNLNEISNNEKSKLQHAMEEGKLLIKKGSFQSRQTINTSIIAAMQPVNGIYNRHKSFRDNFKKDLSLLDKFDIIAFFDIISDQKKHMNEVDTILDGNQNELFSHELLIKYIEYAQLNFRPKFRKDAQDQLKEIFIKIKQNCSTKDNEITKRYLITVKKLCEAYAKLHLRHVILVKDVEIIEQLFQEYLKNLGFDNTIDKIDFNRIFGGQSRININKLETLFDRLKGIFEENDWKALEKPKVVQILELEENLDKKFIENALEELVKDGTLYDYTPRSNKIQLRDPNLNNNY